MVIVWPELRSAPKSYVAARPLASQSVAVAGDRAFQVATEFKGSPLK